MQTYLVPQQYNEGNGEGQDEHEEDCDCLEERDEDVSEHDNVDPEGAEPLDEEHQVRPAEKHGQGRQGPLPVLQYSVRELSLKPPIAVLYHGQTA